MQLYVCEDIEHASARYMCELEEENYFLELDLAIEQELGVWPERDGHYEQIQQEHLPIDWAEV